MSFLKINVDHVYYRKIALSVYFVCRFEVHKSIYIEINMNMRSKNQSRSGCVEIVT
jgi:hypothetical protein